VGKGLWQPQFFTLKGRHRQGNGANKLNDTPIEEWRGRRAKKKKRELIQRNGQRGKGVTGMAGGSGDNEGRKRAQK